MKHEKYCKYCGKKFIAEKSHTRYCSHTCNRRAYKAELKKRNYEFIDELETSLQMAKDSVKEILSVSEAAEFLGIGKSTLYRYIANGIVKVLQLPGVVRIRKKDIESLFDNALPYSQRERAMRKSSERRRSLPDKNPYEGYVTVREFASMSGVCISTAQKLLRKEKVRCVTFRNTGYYDKDQATALIAKLEKEEYPDITEWYTCEEIQKKYNKSKTAVYSMVYDNAIPRKKEGSCSLYSKKHIHMVIGDIEEISKTHYTPQEVMEKYSLNRNQLHNRLNRHSIKRFMMRGQLWISKESFDGYISRIRPQFKP